MTKLSSRSLRTCTSLQIKSSQEYFEIYGPIVDNLPHEDIDKAVCELLGAYDNGKGVFVFGNGGSAALASHVACDLGKGTVSVSSDQKRFRITALTDNVPLMTAWANDHGYEYMFAEQLRPFVAAGDVVFAISGSGNSPNVLRALELARESGATTIGLTGFAGGAMKGLCDICIVIPSDNMQIIEDFHVGVAHAIFSVIRQAIVDGSKGERLVAVAAAD